jgi:photosystem II stability/assembly factor-like uncharacterized protein
MKKRKTKNTINSNIMKTKPNFFFTLSIFLLSFIAIQTGCKKDDPEPDPVKKKYAWAVGAADSTEYALIYFSADGGKNWIRQGEGQASIKDLTLNDVWAVDESTVWAVAQQNVILKTTDGGTNWFHVPPPSTRTDASLSSISIIGKDDIWISGNVVYHSTDGGNSWTSIQSPVLTNKNFQGIHAINSNIVYGAGSYMGTGHGFIARTTDAGQSWDSIVPADNFNKNEWIGITSSDPNNIVVHGGHSHYVYSNDGGQTWTNDSTRIAGGTGGGGPDLNDLTMLDAQTWWGALDYDNIGITNNGGSSLWTNQGPAPGPSGMFLLGIDYYDKDLCIIVGGGAGWPPAGKIIQTSNGGQLWELGLTTGAQMQKVSFIK